MKITFPGTQANFQAERKKPIGIGWRAEQVPSAEIARRITAGENFEVVEFRSGEKVYIATDVPCLSEAEDEFVADFLEEFREREAPRRREEATERVLARHCRRTGMELEKEQEDYLLKTIDFCVSGFGPVSSLLQNDLIEEIALIGIGKSNPLRIYDRNLGWLKTNLYFAREQAAKNCINKMSRRIGRRLTLQTPKLNAVLPDGSRLNAVIEPVSRQGPIATIRKFRSKPFAPWELAANRTFSFELMAFLWMAMQTDLSVIVAGNTGSGKTSTLNALFGFVPSQERIIVVEETPEIALQHRHLVKLNTCAELGIGMQDLIVDTLRMRPDRIIVGEVRNSEEVNAFIDTLLAGQGKGSYATFHAQSGREVMLRMRNLGVMEMDLEAIDLVLVQKRWNRVSASGAMVEERKVVEASEIVQGKTGKTELREIFAFDFAKGRLERKLKGSKAEEKISRCFGIGRSGIRKELGKREKALKAAEKKKMDSKEFFEFVNSEFANYGS